MRREGERTGSGDDEAGAMLRMLHGLWRLGRPAPCGEAGVSLDGGIVPLATVEEAAGEGLVRLAGGTVRLTASGRARLARLAAADLPQIARRLELGLRRVATQEGAADVLVDEAESPLAWLRRRRGKAGEPLISARAFAAGERLRADFTGASLTPRMTLDWDALTRPGRGGGAGAALSDTAADARRRVAAALGAVGPELSGVLLDVCCFLKPLTQVEQERGWPLRSAKLVLTLGLERLGRWYEESAGSPGTRSSPRDDAGGAHVDADAAAWSRAARRSISGAMA